MIAPVEGSGSIPAWITRVANFIIILLNSLPADWHMYFFVVPSNHQAGFIFFFSFETNREYINDIGTGSYFNHRSQDIFFSIISKSTPGICVFIENQNPVINGRNGIQGIPSPGKFLSV